MLKILIYILFVIVILLVIFSILVFFHYRKLYIDVTDNVSSIFDGYRKEMVAIQNLTKQMTEFTNKINKKFDEREKATQARLKQIEQVARYGKR